MIDDVDTGRGLSFFLALCFVAVRWIDFFSSLFGGDDTRLFATQRFLDFFFFFLFHISCPLFWKILWFPFMIYGLVTFTYYSYCTACPFFLLLLVVTCALLHSI